MSALMRRVERLEEQQSAKDGLTVFLIRWSGDGPIVEATYGGSQLMRGDDESEVEFYSRSEQWAKTLPGANWGRCVWMNRGQPKDVSAHYR